MKKKDKIRKIIVYSLAVLFLLGSIQVHVPSGNPQWMLSEKETVLTSFSEDMKLVDCKKEENENGPFNEGKEENRQSQDGERLLYYLAVKKAWTSASVKMSTLELGKLTGPGGTFQGLDRLRSSAGSIWSGWCM